MVKARGLSMMFGLALLCGPALAEPVQVKVGDALARMDLVKPGVHRYLRYKIKDGERQAMDIWTRRVAYEPKDGKRLLHISQRWDEVGPPSFFLDQDSWFDPATFRPLTHLRRGNKGGELKIKAYRFDRDAVVGQAEIDGNQAAEYRVATPEPVFNFEYDMEMLQALPLAEGFEANLPFLDAGIDEPGRYVFKVAGSDRIAGPDGKQVDCWLVTADYNTGKVLARFWFAKGSQVLLHEEVTPEEGVIVVKTLIGAEDADHAV